MQATDPDDDDVLTYSLSGPDDSDFTIDRATGQIRTRSVLDPSERDAYEVHVSVHDGFDSTYSPSTAEDDSIVVTIRVTESSQATSSGGGGGGGAPPEPRASDEDYDWNVTRDIEALAHDNGDPTGLWSDGTTIWVLNNPSSGQDELFAYDLETGKRQEALEFELDSTHRFTHGIWSDGVIVFVADSRADMLFVYHLQTGERLPDRDIELHERNRNPGGIWSDGTTIYVLDSVEDAIFLYLADSGEFVAEFALDRLNRSPRGIWSDGLTIWVSDDGANRIFAYRLVDGQLIRYEDEEFSFRSLLQSGNGDPRGIWSDGEVVYVADARDDRVYSYNLPDAIDARLGSLSLEPLELPGFSPQQQRYELSVDGDISQSTVEAAPAHEGAVVEISPVDTDGNPQNGHQVALAEETEIEITVTSEDGSRTRVYVIAIERENRVPMGDRIPPLELTLGGEPVRLVLGDYFSDPDGDPLRYIVGDPAQPGVVSVSEVDGVLTLTPVRVGAASFELSASDGELLSSPQTLAVTVEEAPSVAPEVRIAARQVTNERVEFALQVRSEDRGWQRLILPQRRFLSAAAEVDRWHVSTAIAVGADEAARTVRIGGRRVSSGSVEFALLVLDDEGAWSARLLPSARFLPADADQDQWRYSTPLRVEPR